MNDFKHTWKCIQSFQHKEYNFDAGEFYDFPEDTELGLSILNQYAENFMRPNEQDKAQMKAIEKKLSELTCIL